jgi:hypothetical protein
MSDELLAYLEDGLTRHREGKPISEPENRKLQEFVAQWFWKVREVHPSSRIKQISGYSNEMVFVAFSELDYLVREEIKSRRLGYVTYKFGIENFFDSERIRYANPDFLRTILRYRGFDAMADGDMTGPLSSIAKLFEH